MCQWDHCFAPRWGLGVLTTDYSCSIQKRAMSCFGKDCIANCFSHVHRKISSMQARINRNTISKITSKYSERKLEKHDSV